MRHPTTRNSGHTICVLKGQNHRVVGPAPTSLHFSPYQVEPALPEVGAGTTDLDHDSTPYKILTVGRRLHVKLRLAVKKDMSKWKNMNNCLNHRKYLIIKESRTLHIFRTIRWRFCNISYIHWLYIMYIYMKNYKFVRCKNTRSKIS